MAEAVSRSQMDNASVSSEGSFKVPRLDPPKKLGPGALRPDEFDPLKHNEWEKFWHQIDYNFHPVNTDHVLYFRDLPVNPYNGLHDIDLRLTHAMDAEPSKVPESREKKRDAKRESKREKCVDEGISGKRPADRSMTHNGKGEPSPAALRSTSSANSELAKLNQVDVDSSTLRASLNSIPYTHRLVAALLDENATGTAAPTSQGNRTTRPSLPDEMLWMGVGTESEVRAYQSALEERVQHELRENGLLDESKDDEVQTAIRQEQWKLRPLKTANRQRKIDIHSKMIVTELPSQATRREAKRREDKIEIAYLERMVSKMKKNKKSRSKFQKLLQRMFGHYKEKEKNNDKAKKVAESISNGRAITNGDVRSSGKKKKKKINHDLPAKSAAAHAGISRKSAP